MTRDEALAKALEYIDEQVMLIVHDAETGLERSGAPEDEVERIRAHNKRALQDLREQATEVIDNFFSRGGQELH